jgi:hypothetical protein
VAADGDADDDGVCDGDEIVGCQSQNACNYNAAATDAGSCIFAIGCEFCQDGVAADGDSDDDGVCDGEDNCSQIAACNYFGNGGNGCVYFDACGTCGGNGTDLNNNNICDSDEVNGCTHEAACNYNASANVEDGSCTFAAAGLDCNGACLFDADQDGVCDQNEVTGCQDNYACNYAANATNAGYCAYPATHYDCDGVCLADADNDGVCDALEVAGCTDPTALNYSPVFTQSSGNCIYASDIENTCPADLNGDNAVNVSDLLDLLVSFEQPCP